MTELILPGALTPQEAAVHEARTYRQQSLVATCTSSILAGLLNSDKVEKGDHEHIRKMLAAAGDLGAAVLEQSGFRVESRRVPDAEGEPKAP